ncbi:MAG: cytochrome c5 [Kiritimatiellia bacterium]
MFLNNLFLNKPFSTIIKIALCSMAVFASAVGFAAVKDDISARTSPMGSLCMSGEQCAAAPIVVASGPRSGEDIYGSKCIACHGSGAAGAPKLGDTAAWAARIGKGIDVLYTGAISGINGMPDKGLCLY